MNIVEKKMYKLNPGYLERFEDLLRRYSQFGGGAVDDKYTQGRSFSNVYEFYAYAFFIGLYKDAPMDLSDDDNLRSFWEIENWRPKEMIDHILACALARSDFDMFAVQEKEEAEVTADMRILRRTIEQYANGGLNYISKRAEEDPDQAEQDDFFLNMMID
ncbi:MAG: hypothetical protein OXE97_02555 [Gammaproteobacteria bacterium]|nr:hypothetical protein [Gammaproteobacteria bacterium]MCY4305713.1 hypothetical protein [Aestuariivita sp.]